MTTSTFRIFGSTMLDGYVAGRGARFLDIEVRDGRAFDTVALDLMGAHAEPLRLTEDGELSDSARGGFLPGEGEIDRFEAAIGRQMFVRA